MESELGKQSNDQDDQQICYDEIEAIKRDIFFNWFDRLVDYVDWNTKILKSNTKRNIKLSEDILNHRKTAKQ